MFVTLMFNKVESNFSVFCIPISLYNLFLNGKFYFFTFNVYIEGLHRFYHGSLS